MLVALALLDGCGQAVIVDEFRQPVAPYQQGPTEAGSQAERVYVEVREVLEVNQKVVDEPETVNDEPYGEGWLIRIRISDPAQIGSLLDAAAYRQLLESQ